MKKNIEAQERADLILQKMRDECKKSMRDHDIAKTEEEVDEICKASFAGYIASKQERKSLYNPEADTDDIRRELFWKSPYNIMLCFMQMDEAGFEGIPHMDTKTLKAWNKLGYRVKKGEKCKIHVPTFVSGKKEEGEDDAERMGGYFKTANLFHFSQVEKVK